MREPSSSNTVLSNAADESDAGAAKPGVNDYVLAMNHELKAPLNAVIGISALLLDGELADRQRQYVKSINSAGESLATILNDLLDLTKIAAGRLIIEPIPFDLRSMVEETVKALAPEATARGLALRVDWRPELPRQVVGDPGRTRQVLGNLVGHAMNATSRGEVVIRLAPDSSKTGKPLIKFSVEDTGIGLQPERLATVFDEYVPVDASPYRSFGITGLGLRISSELVRLMGGEIGVDSQLGKGSQFWFRLGMAPADVEAEPVRFAPRMLGQDARMLIVESDQSSRRRMTDQLQSGGWTLDFIDDLAQVEDRLRAGKDAGTPYRMCILSDYAVRPVHPELASRIKADERLRSVSLVILTAVGSPGEGKRLWHAGFAAYLRKPVPPEELADAMIALEAVGPDGKAGSLITRHSIAEARNSETTSGFDDLDEVLASLTAPVTRQAMTIGVTGPTKLEITDAAAQCGMAMSSMATVDEAVARFDPSAHDIVLVNADAASMESFDAVARMVTITRESRRIALVAITGDLSNRDRLLAMGYDDVVTKPIRQNDLARILARDWSASPTSESREAPETQATVVEEVEPQAPADATIESSLAIETTVESSTEESGADVVPVEMLAIESNDVVGLEHFSTADDARSIEAAPLAGLISFDAGQIASSGDGAKPNVATDPDLMSSPFAESTVSTEPADTTAIQPVDGLETAETVLEPAPESSTEPEPLALDMATLPADLATEPSVELPPEQTAEQPPVERLAEDRAGQPPVETSPTQPEDIAATAELEIGMLTLIEPEVDSAPPPPMTSVAAKTVSSVEEIELTPDLPVLSAAFMDQLASGTSFARHLAVTFLRDAPVTVTDLGAATTAGDANRASNALKALKSMAGLLGAARLADLCASFETDLEQSGVAAIAERSNEIHETFLEIRNMLSTAVPERAPVDLEAPALGGPFADQLSPSRDGPTRTLALKLAETFRGEAPARLDELVKAIERQDADAAQRLAPTLKGMCGLIGATPLAKLCALVEADARLKRIAGAGRYVDQLRYELGRVLTALDRALAGEPA